jgi:hypothetical protein
MGARQLVCLIALGARLRGRLSIEHGGGTVERPTTYGRTAGVSIGIPFARDIR